MKLLSLHFLQLFVAHEMNSFECEVISCLLHARVIHDTFIGPQPLSVCMSNIVFLSVVSCSCLMICGIITSCNVADNSIAHYFIITATKLLYTIAQAIHNSTGNTQ